MTLGRRALLSDLCRYCCHISSASVEPLFLMAPYLNMDITVNHPPLRGLAMFPHYCITDKNTCRSTSIVLAYVNTVYFHSLQ